MQRTWVQHLSSHFIPVPCKAKKKIPKKAYMSKIPLPQLQRPCFGELSLRCKRAQVCQSYSRLRSNGKPTRERSKVSLATVSVIGNVPRKQNVYLGMYLIEVWS